MGGVISDDVLHHGWWTLFGAATNNANKEVTFVLWECVRLKSKTPEGVDTSFEVFYHALSTFNIPSTQFAFPQALPF